MMYRTGDYVYPTDLTRRFLCRVAATESVRIDTGVAQILRLEALEGPWPAGTLLVRLDDRVRQVWRTGRRARRPGATVTAVDQRERIPA
ncbi:MAG TPA: hypothetical protein VKU61_06840 [Candidatus Binatia bacterium]|nr:hypothetical protein [Candidatus Binatia bacterium]